MVKNNPKRRGLGRGLGSLIVNTESGIPPSERVIEQAEAGGIRLISVDAIQPNPHQPRTNFDETALTELAASIREHGILQPLIVTKTQSQNSAASLEQEEAYWIVAGERRWRAAQRADLNEVPAIVRETTPQQLMEWALVENIQRADLNPLEEAAAYQALINELNMTQAQVAERVAKSRSAVANILRLQTLPVEAQNALLSNLISAGHARALLALPDSEIVNQALDMILAEELTVRQTETLVKQLLEPETGEDEPEIVPDVDHQMQTHLTYLEDRFRSALGTKVSLTRNGDGSGRLVVHFYNDDDLDNIYQVVAGSDE